MVEPLSLIFRVFTAKLSGVRKFRNFTVNTISVLLGAYSALATIKFLNFGTPEIFAVIYLKFKQRGQTSGYFVKCKWSKWNSKQWRPWSDCSSRSSLIWVCTVCPYLSVRKLRVITVFTKCIEKTMLILEAPNTTKADFCKHRRSRWDCS